MGKNDIISIDKVEYQKWLQTLCDEIDRQRLKAVMQLNASTLQHYWWLGNDILKKQQAQGWGAKVIDMLSTNLLKRYGNDSGYSIRNLKYMRKFAVEYPDFPFVQVPLAQLQDNQLLKSRLSKFTVTADSEFVQVPLAQITWYHHISMFPKQFQMMKEAFVDKGYPVILGEYGANWREFSNSSIQKKHDASLWLFHKTINEEAIKHGIIPYVWDINNPNRYGTGGIMCIIDRSKPAVFDTNSLDGIMSGAAAATWGGPATGINSVC